MFTGIIQATGTLGRREPRGGDLRVYIAAADLDPAGLGTGESIAVNGVCLTAAALDDGGFWADVSRETLEFTTLGELERGAPVNLERSLTLAQPLGGHLVSGHVDGVGRLLSVRGDARSYRLTIEAPHALARYVARKGSIAVDGISLTVNDVAETAFELNIVPHTWTHTNLRQVSEGGRVNLEVDVVARYLERLLVVGRDQDENTEAGWLSLLRRQGFAE